MRLNFAKAVSREQRQYLRQTLKEYEANTPMTEEERQELYAWVSEGNDIYSNPSNVASESGWEMDFISGIRADAEQYERLSAMSPEELADELGWNRPIDEDDLLLD